MVLAIFIVYCFFAYLVIPLGFRFWQLVFKPNHLPVYAITSDGWASDPVNIVIVSQSRWQFMSSMRLARWVKADPSSLVNLAKMLFAMVLRKPYPAAPFSKLYLFGRKQDVGFQIQTGTPPTPWHRHHVRFWRLREGEVTHQHHSFWQNLLLRFFGRKKQVWVGSATHDIRPFALRWRNLQVTHWIDEDTNKERDFLIQSLKDIGAVKSVSEIKAGEPLKFRGQTFGVGIVVDGYVKVVELKRPSLVGKIKSKLN
jgi:hypothetical protein